MKSNLIWILPELLPRLDPISRLNLPLWKHLDTAFYQKLVPIDVVDTSWMSFDCVVIFWVCRRHFFRRTMRRRHRHRKDRLSCWCLNVFLSLLYRLVNRLHFHLKWKWKWKCLTTFRALKFQFLMFLLLNVFFLVCNLHTALFSLK